MGKRGPAKTPTAVLSMTGSWRAIARGPNEPQAPSGLPDMPDWLIEPEREVWQQVVDRLDQIGTLHRTDGEAIGRYCSLLVRWVTAKQFIEKNGTVYVVKNSKGEVHRFQPYPQAIDYKHLLPMILRLEQEFGLTPSSRAGLSIKPSAGQQDAEAIYFGS